MLALVRATTLLFASMLLSLSPAAAQAWPTKPVKIVVSFAAGATPDIICRLISERLSAALGQPVIVDNRPGGANVVGAVAVKNSVADGYTLYFATAAALVSNPYTFKNLPYDPVKDFVPVSMVAKNPFMILVHPSVPANTLPEVADYDKKNPGKLAFATDGKRNFSGILATWLNKVSGANILQIPYATMPQGVQDTIAGRTQLTILSPPSAAPQINSGALKPIAVSWSKRLPQYPKVPPVADSYPGVELTGWFALVAPTGTPAEVITRVNAEMDKILKAPDLVKRLADLGFYTEGAETPEATRAFIKAQHELWGRVVKEIGLEPE